MKGGDRKKMSATKAGKLSKGKTKAAAESGAKSKAGKKAASKKSRHEDKAKPRKPAPIPAREKVGGGKLGEKVSPAASTGVVGTEPSSSGAIPSAGGPTNRPMLPRTAEQIGSTPMGPRPVPPLRATGPDIPPPTAVSTLTSGLSVLVVRKPATPLVEVRLRIPFGGTSALHAARAELLAATILLGTASRSREQVDADLAAVGGHLGANVDPQRLSVSGSVLAHGLPEMLEVLADSLTQPAYRRTDVLGERDRLVEHLSIASAQPSTVARQYLQQQRFGDHPASREMPTAEAVAGVGPAALHGMHSRSVVPAGSTLVLVGDLNPEQTIALVDKLFTPWQATRKAVGLQTPPPIPAGSLRAHHRSGAVQSQIRLTAGAVGRTDPQYAAAQLANLVYGGYFSSRLVENIREDKGYTYHAQSSIEFWPGRAAVTVSFDTNNDASVAALLEARYELGRIALTPPAESEIEAARNYALGTLATSLATQAGYASTVSALSGYGLDPGWLSEHRGRLAAVSPAEVATAATGLLAPSRFTGVVVGDLDAIGDRLSALGGVSMP